MVEFRSDVVHEGFCLAIPAVDITDGCGDIGQRRVIENGGHGITDLAHDHLRPTPVFIHAFVALSVCGFACAWERGQGPVDVANDVPNSYLVRSDRQLIAAPLTLLALHYSALLQFAKNHLQKLSWDLFCLGETRNENGSATVRISQCV